MTQTANRRQPQFGSPAPNWKRTNRHNHCPVCGKFGWCEVSDDRTKAHCMHTPSAIEMHHRQGGWLHILVNSPALVATAADLRPVPQLPQPLAPALVSQINRALLAHCPLNEKHQKYLEAEGVPPAGCGSLNYKAARDIARDLVNQFGEATARRHPALLEVTSKDGRKWWTIASAADGLLFPATNHEGLILGIQIRKDQPKGSDDRYRWLSHEGLGGTPLTLFRAKAGAGNSHYLIITEGYKKAAVAAGVWQCHAISLAGVNAYSESELIKTVEALGVTAISLAFDQDKRTKPQVQEAEQRLLRTLAAVFPRSAFYSLNWAGEKAKGLDDAVKSEVEIQLDPANFSGKRFVNDLPAEALARQFGTARPLYTLPEVRSLHRQLFEKVFLNPDNSRRVVTSTTGTGKSYACDATLAGVLITGLLGRERVLLLAPSKANIAERTAPGTGLGRAVRLGLAAIQRGRNPIDLERPRTPQPEDCANPLAQDAGAARQIAAKVVCKDCPFGSEKNWLEHAKEYGYDPNQPRPFKCEEEGYIASRRRSEAAQVVIATKESFLNNSEMLEDFTIVICDEGLLDYLIEKISIDTNALASWREKMALKNFDIPAWRQLMRIIEKAFDTLAEKAKAEKKRYNELLDCPPVLESAAEALGYNYTEVLSDCGFYTNRCNEGEKALDTPYRHQTKLRLPFRAARELLDSLTNPDNPAQFQRQADGSYSLLIHRVRRHLVDLLRQRTVVVMDATMPPQLRMLLPDIEEVRYEVPQAIHISQVTSGLYSRDDLANPRTRERVAQAIDAFVLPGSKNLTIMPMRFEQSAEALAVPEGTDAGHWGKDDRATNDYKGHDSLVLVGHPMRPIDFIRAEVIACRAYAGIEAPEPGQQKQRLRMYNHLLPNGHAAGRYMKQHEDPDVQAAIEFDYFANVTQATGRLRAAERAEAGLPPARVLLFCNEPAGDVPINQLVTVDELVTNPPKNQLFIMNTYMKSTEKGELVRSYTAVEEGREALDEQLIQDWQDESPDQDPWNLSLRE